MSDKNFIGNVKQITFQNGGSILKLGIKEDDLKGLANERGYINLVIAKKREINNDGKDYYCYLDEYKPQAEEATPEQQPASEQNDQEQAQEGNLEDNDEVKVENIPF